MAADSGQVVSDVPVGRVTGHVDTILGHTWTGGLSWILLTGVVEFVLETHRQNVHQLRKKKQIIIMQHRNVSQVTNHSVIQPSLAYPHTHLLESIRSVLLPAHRDVEHIAPCRHTTVATTGRVYHSDIAGRAMLKLKKPEKGGLTWRISRVTCRETHRLKLHSVHV